MILLALIGAPLLGGLIAGIDRRLTARLQARTGPPILQPFYDVGKLFGKRGVFYDIMGYEVRCLDGFYPDVFPEYGEYGILVPENCSEVCDEIYAATGVPCVIVDANDFSCDIFGKCACVQLPDDEICKILRDNPAGQSDACTPFVLVTQESC